MVVARNDADFDDWDRHWKDIENTMAMNPAHEYRRSILFRNLNLASVPSPRVLDVGSGLGDFLIALSDQYPEVPKLGLELAQTGVDIASRRLPQATFLQRDLIAGGEGPGAYAKFATHAVCSEVLEHVDDPVRLLENARAYMAKGCRLVVTVPGGPRSALDLHIGHRRHFTPASIREVLNKAGFTVLSSVGAGFPFFNLYRLLVILRGNKLIDDAASEPSYLLRFTCAVFRACFKLNKDNSRFGWQIVAIATSND